jgi:hypothetical protein
MTDPTYAPLTGNEAIAEYDLSDLFANGKRPLPWLGNGPAGDAPSYRVKVASRVLFVPGQLLDNRCHDWWLMTHGTKPPPTAEREKQFRKLLQEVQRHSVCHGDAWVLNARVPVPHAHPQLGTQPYTALGGHEITRFGWAAATPMTADGIGDTQWLAERYAIQDWAAKLLLEHSELFAAAVVDSLTYATADKGGVRLLVAW